MFRCLIIFLFCLSSCSLLENKLEDSKTMVYEKGQVLDSVYQTFKTINGLSAVSLINYSNNNFTEDSIEFRIKSKSVLDFTVSFKNKKEMELIIETKKIDYEKYNEFLRNKNIIDEKLIFLFEFLVNYKCISLRQAVDKSFLYYYMNLNQGIVYSLNNKEPTGLRFLKLERIKEGYFYFKEAIM